MALRMIQRAIDAVTSGSAGDVAPDPKIQIMKAMEQRWALIGKAAMLADGFQQPAGFERGLRRMGFSNLLGLSVWLMGFLWVRMGSSRGGSVVRFLRDWLGVNSKLRKWNVQDWAMPWIDLQEMWVVQMGFRFIRI
ncbi:hypothetical protein F0562_034157 [Nyssa sinensis]|uniref:Uncharacterized protein n=1 Tax=Nyssa sinensis TaxID=561372 RepID=A0A5J5AFH2_9ASTE|nr:hypothetical protein F0562_034157 [Nyssa sinensis]